MNSQQISGAAVPNKNSHAVPGTRVALSLAIAAMLSACALAPGQHMITPAALPVTTADNGDVTSDMQIPIKQIDLTLIRQIHAAQKNDTTAQAQLNLFAKPAGYKVGPGDVIVIPPGVAHWFSTVESDMNYLVVRVDGDHILPAGYVNPAVKTP